MALLVGAVAALLLAVGALEQVQGPTAPVGANVADNVSAANTVDAGCSPGGSDCAKRISDTIRNNRARPLKVTFGAGTSPGTVFTFGTEVRMASNVVVEGVNQPVVRSRSSKLSRIGGLSNIAFQGFDIDLDRCGATKNVFFVGNGEQVDNVRISDVRAFDGDANAPGGGSCVFFASRGTGTDIELLDVSAHRLRRVVWFNVGSDHRRLTISKMAATEFGYQALSFDGYVENLTIDGSSFSRHARNTKGSHIIAFSPAETLTEVKSRNVVIRNTLLEGWPDTPHIKIDGVTQPNGASGDLLALRGTDGFLLESNTFRHGGEVGITITAGAKNGIVRHNSVSYTDTTGIVLGNGNTIRVTNIDVYGNDLFQNSLDRDGTHRPLPALSVWGVTGSCVVHNDIHDNASATGLWVWNGHLPPHWPRSVEDMYIADNQFRNNLHDFVQSSRPTRNFEPASSSGGTNWTSTFGSPDRDGDGFGSICSSETDDANPCVPFTGAAACDGTPPTTGSTTTIPATTTTIPATTTTVGQSTTTTTGPTTTTTTTAGPTTTTTTTTTRPTTTTTSGQTTTTSGGGQVLCNGLVPTIVGTE
ncbi:MAG: hypothetical protein ACR2QK_11065, partial [Acidimicrobiales bacterium]